MISLYCSLAGITCAILSLTCAVVSVSAKLDRVVEAINKQRGESK